MPKVKDITGKRFGEWVVLSFVEINKKSRKAVWKCICSCGIKAFVSGVQLRSGHSKRCGACGQKQAAISRRLDLKGRVFGRCTAISPTKQRIASSIVWKVKCSCGRNFKSSATGLISGHTTSCGCFQVERATKIASVLGSANQRAKLLKIDVSTAYQIEILQRELEQTGVLDHAPDEQTEIEQKLEVARTDVIPPWVKGN